MRVFKRFLSFIYKRKYWILAIVIVIGVLYFIFKPKQVIPVPTQRIKRSDIIQTVSISGKVNAKKIVDLTFQIGGKITFVGVQVGDHVSQYQTIAILDSRTTQKNLQAALIAYSKQRNAFDQNQDNLQNRTPDQALNDSMKRILQNNQYDLNNAINSVELLSLAQEQSILTTPIAGIVTRVDAKTAGVNVTPTSVFEVVDPNSLVFDMDVDEADIGKITMGQEADVQLDAYPDVTVKNPVNFIDFVSHITTNGGNAFTVETALTDPSGLKYRLGMNGNANIITSRKNDVITAPSISIVDGQFVYVKTKNGFEKKQVTVGLQSDTDGEIKNGLQVGDVVATDPVAAANNK